MPALELADCVVRAAPVCALAFNALRQSSQSALVIGERHLSLWAGSLQGRLRIGAWIGRMLRMGSWAVQEQHQQAHSLSEGQGFYQMVQFQLLKAHALKKHAD